MNSNSSFEEQPELKFIEGGPELLDDVRPLWKKLNDLHAETSPHFADAFAKTKFLGRKEELKNKAVTGQLLVILALTKADECMAIASARLTKRVLSPAQSR